jgi:P-type Cu+ transporter
MSNTKQLTLPITGMTCANCVATVERNLKKLDGVNSAVVNLSSERATVEFDVAKLGLGEAWAWRYDRTRQPRGLWRGNRRS